MCSECLSPSGHSQVESKFKKPAFASLILFLIYNCFRERGRKGGRGKWKVWGGGRERKIIDTEHTPQTRMTSPPVPSPSNFPAIILRMSARLSRGMPNKVARLRVVCWLQLRKPNCWKGTITSLAWGTITYACPTCPRANWVYR